MKSHHPRSIRAIVLPLLCLSLAALLACGTTATATPESTATPVPQQGAQERTEPAATDGTPVPTPQPTATIAPAPDTTGEPTGTLRIALDEVDPPKWIPKLQGAPQNSINNTTFWESLWANERGEGLVSVLAKSWEVSPDNTVWTIHLQEGIPFHYGYGELTAEDVLWTMENTVEEGTVVGRAELFRQSFFPEGGGITVVDDHTIEVDTVEPRFDLTWFMTMGMSNSMGRGVPSKKDYEDVGPEEAAFTQAVGTGPWRSVSHETGGTWRFEAVQDHWRKAPNFAELDYIEIAEESTRLANFQAGTLDTAKFNLESVNVLEEECGECKFMSFSTGGQLFIIIHGQMYVDRPDLPTPRNSDLPWISANPDINSEEWQRAAKVRRAMNVAINRDLLVETILRGKGAPLHVYGWAGFEDRMGELADLKYPYDPDLARQLLAEAGYEDGFEVPFALTNRPYPGTIETAEAVAVMWEEVGLRTQQSRQPMSSFRSRFPARDWVGVNSHGQAVQIEPTAVFGELFSTRGVINYGVEHPVVQDLVDRIQQTFDDEERLALVRELSKFIFDHSLVTPTVSVFQVWPVGPRINEWETLCCVTRVLTNLEYIPTGGERQRRPSPTVL